MELIPFQVKNIVTKLSILQGISNEQLHLGKSCFRSIDKQNKWHILRFAFNVGLSSYVTNQMVSYSIVMVVQSKINVFFGNHPYYYIHFDLVIFGHFCSIDNILN